MSKTPSHRAKLTLPKAPSAPTLLAEQKADFTAEGSPPPGLVASSVPTTDTKPVKPKRRSAARYP